MRRVMYVGRVLVPALARSSLWIAVDGGFIAERVMAQRSTRAHQGRVRLESVVQDHEHRTVSLVMLNVDEFARAVTLRLEGEAPCL
jgi:hypothetical protein